MGYLKWEHKSGPTHEKMIIILTSVKQAQRPNTLYCGKTCVFLLLKCYPKTL